MSMRVDIEIDTSVLPGFESTKSVHDLKHVIERISGHEGGLSLVKERPLFDIHFLFFAFRQFLRDMAYAFRAEDMTRAYLDLCFLTVGMAVVDRVLDRVVEDMKRILVDESVEVFIRDANNYDRLRELVSSAYTQQVLEDTPQTALYRSWFCE